MFVPFGSIANINPRLGLYHFATTDLPGDAVAPELDDRNAARALKSDIEFTGEDLSGGAGVTEDTMGRYLAYLIATGFLQAPPSSGNKKLPVVQISPEQKTALRQVGGRGGLV